jgi:alpha-L-fucosidase
MAKASGHPNSFAGSMARDPGVSRRTFIQLAVAGGVTTTNLGGTCALSPAESPSAANQKVNAMLPNNTNGSEAGAQRLSRSKLGAWEDLRYGMFIHFGVSTYVVGKEFPDIPDGKAPASTYNPDKLDVDQWVQIARDAGMKYAVLTTKHVAGHCLWPSRIMNYTVARSGNTTDVVGAFVKSCERRGVVPGLYYDSYDNHNLFGQVTVSPEGDYPWQEKGLKTTYTTSLYQDFQTAQVTELLTQYGPIGEVWIDIPQLLGRGYRTFLYEHIARLQPDSVIMMNSSKLETAWPTDLRSFERGLPPASGYVNWQEIEGKRYYLPGEISNTIGKNWFFVEGDHPRPDEELLTLLLESRKRGVNLLLDVPPDKHGLIPDEARAALMRLRKNANL